MALHDDVLGRILTILKQDDYYRTLEELPTIDSLRTYDDIKLFPELNNTITIIERVTSEADLIKDSYDDRVCTLYLKLLYLPLQGSYLDQHQHSNQSHQPIHNTRLMPKIYISSRALGHHQEVHSRVDNAHPLPLSEIQAHPHRLPYPPACNTSIPKPQ